MANFDRVKADWASGNPEAPDFTELDVNVTKTANFADGSTHAPSAPVIIGGSGLQLTTPLTANVVNGTDLNASDDVTASDRVTAGGRVVAGTVVEAGTSVEAATFVDAGTYVEAATTVTAGTNVVAVGDVLAGDDVIATGDVVGTDVDATDDVTAGDRVTAGGQVNSGTSMNATTSVNAGTTMHAAGTISTDDDIQADGDANIGGNANVTNDVNVGDDVNIGGNMNCAGDANIGADVDFDGYLKHSVQSISSATPETYIDITASLVFWSPSMGTDEFWIRLPSNTSGREVTINFLSTSAGATLKFYSSSNALILTVECAAAVTYVEQLFYNRGTGGVNGWYPSRGSLMATEA